VNRSNNHPGIGNRLGFRPVTRRQVARRVPVTPGVVYQLAESGGDPRFIQVDRRTDDSNPLSTGSMDCVELDENGEVIPGFSDGINGGVAVPLGASVRCTAINVAATLGLRKVVVNNSGGTAVPEDWELTATPIGDVPPGVGPVTVTGSDAVLGELFTVRPNIEYALTETDVPGYVLDSLDCFLVPRRSGGNIISVDPLDTAVCTFTNFDEPAELTLVKVVENGETGGTAVPSDWMLSADGPTPVTGPGNSPDVTDQPVDPGPYSLSEEGPPGYDASSWECDGGTLSGSTVQVPPAADVTCTITNTAQPPRWTLEKSSDPVSGSTVDPGDRITYTITAAKLAGVDPTDLVVTDDLSAVLDNATLVAGSITPSTGTAELSGDRLVWSIPTLSNEETLSYTVRVDGGADEVQLVNVITGTGPTPPEECPAADSADSSRAITGSPRRTPLRVQLAALAADPCSTTHNTPRASPATSLPSSPAQAGAGQGSELGNFGGPQWWLAPLGLGLLIGGIALALSARLHRGQS
jgi:uncharacterized repeat protein (TIGR01451 family)